MAHGVSPMAKGLRIGLAGLGTVGRGVARIVKSRATEWETMLGGRLQLNSIAVRSATTARREEFPEVAFTTDPLELATNPDLDVIVEVMGGTTDALALVRAALKSGKHIVTANKALLAEHGRELISLAVARGRALRFEAAVAGGVPVITTLEHGLSANRIVSVRGILNGTTNFILSSMENLGCEYGDALKEAQRIGFAEADPALDVRGIDAAQKLAILAHVAWRKRVDWRTIPTVGIEGIRAVDVLAATNGGYSIRLIAGVEQPSTDEPGYAGVAPMLVPGDSIWGATRDGMNTVEIVGDSVGRLTLSGPGAGGAPTASAVVSDLIAIASGAPAHLPARSTGWDSNASVLRFGAAARVHSHYLRITVPEPADHKKNRFRDVLQSCLEASGVKCEIGELEHNNERALVAWTMSPIPADVIDSVIRGLRQATQTEPGMIMMPVMDESGDLHVIAPRDN